MSARKMWSKNGGVYRQKCLLSEDTGQTVIDKKLLAPNYLVVLIIRPSTIHLPFIVLIHYTLLAGIIAQGRIINGS